MRDYVKWQSHHLDRDMEFLWFGTHGRPVMLFPTSAGRFYENEDFGLVGSLGEQIGRGEIQVVCPDTVNDESWYNHHAQPADRIRRHMQYDAYLHDELVPYVMHRARRDDLVVYGASFGAYHASNFAARYPEKVFRAVCFSGVYDIHDFLDGWWSDDCYFHCPTAFIPNMNEHDSRRIASVEWVIATGEYDMVVQKNREFASVLHSKGVAAYAEFWQGQFGHDWRWWKEHLRRFVG